MAYPDPPTTPPVPQRGDRETFSARVDAFLTWVAAIIPWLQGFVADFLATLSTLAAGGANSFSYRFSTDTSVADPGPGFLRLNSATQNAASRLIIDPLDRNSVDISAVLNQITASTSSIKGSVRLQKVGDPTAWMLFDITGFTAATGFYNLTLSLRASSSPSPFSGNDNILVFTERNGDRGDNSSVSASSKFSDRKPFNIGGGSNVAGLNARTFNTIDFNDIPNLSMSNNTFLIPTGSYEVLARSPASSIGAHRLQLFNVTDASIQLRGSNSFSQLASSNKFQTEASLTGKFTITSPKTFRLEHYTAFAETGTPLNVALGYPVSVTGEMEVYSEVIFRKIG